MRALLFLVLFFLTGGLGTPCFAQNLDARLAEALSAPALVQAEVGALVVRDRDGKVLFDFQANRNFVPASNAKILTAVAALSHWGVAHRFTTVVESDRTPDIKGEVGKLCLRGGGDPLLTSEEWWRLAADLKLKGLRRVTGDVFLDASFFDKEEHHPFWGEVTDRAYHSGVVALAANYGAFQVVVAPIKSVGSRPRVLIDPPVPYLVLVNTAEMGSGLGSRLRVSRVKKEKIEEVHVSGDMLLDSVPASFYRNVSDPVSYAGSVFKMQLAALQISIEGMVRVGKGECEERLLAFDGQPLSLTVQRFLKWSNNNIGEMLIKGLGASRKGKPGTWTKGLEAAHEEMSRFGVDLRSAVWVDGSGLSSENRLSPRILVEVLQRAQGSTFFGAEIKSSLPIGGLDGTLRERVARGGTQIRAKTGRISGAMGLSGYAVDSSGDNLTFSVLVNGQSSPDGDIAIAIDNFVAILGD